MALILTVNQPLTSSLRKLEVLRQQQQEEERTIPVVMETPITHTHDHYWSNAKKEAAERMAQIIRGAKPSTEAEVHSALAYVLRHRGPGVAAEMMMLVNTWQQACHELNEHTA